MAQYHEDAGVNGISDKLFIKQRQKFNAPMEVSTCTIHGVEGA